MQKQTEEMTVPELKSLGYDQQDILVQTQNNLMAIRQELIKRQKEDAKKPVSFKEVKNEDKTKTNK